MEKDAPLVSVIMNCFNGEKYLREAIDSVYAQTYKNWEIIFWDNASIDSSGEIAQSYDEKLKYYRVEKNKPLGEARNFAMQKSKGKYIAFLDVDDLYLPTKLEKQINAISNQSDVGLIYSRCKVVSEANKPIGEFTQRVSLPSGNDVFSELVKDNFIPFVSALVDRGRCNDVGGFSEHYRNSTDYDLFLKLSYTYKVIAINEVLCKYRRHSDNLSHSQYSIGAKESLNSVELFLPDQRAIIGMKYKYASLITAYIKEKKFLKAILFAIKNGGWFIIVKRLIKKLVPRSCLIGGH